MRRGRGTQGKNNYVNAEILSKLKSLFQNFIFKCSVVDGSQHELMD